MAFTDGEEMTPRNLFFILGSILILTGPERSVPSAWAGETVDRIVAMVGGEIITLSDVKKYKEDRIFDTKDKKKEETKDPLDALIREKVLKLEMERLQITATDADINSAVQEVLKRNHAPLEALKSELSKKGTTFEQYRKELTDQIRQMKFMSQVIFPRIKLTEDEVTRHMENASEEARLRARMELFEARAPEELEHYLDEARARVHIEIKK